MSAMNMLKERLILRGNYQNGVSDGVSDIIITILDTKPNVVTVTIFFTYLVLIIIHIYC